MIHSSISQAASSLSIHTNILKLNIMGVFILKEI